MSDQRTQPETNKSYTSPSPQYGSNSKLVGMKTTFDLCYLTGFVLVGSVQSAVPQICSPTSGSREYFWLMGTHTILSVENIYI